MKIGVVGAGYVGLITGVVLASKGYEVVCLDKERSIVSSLQSGVPHIHEAGLDVLLKQTLQTGNLEIAIIDKDYLTKCDLIFICVDTPNANGNIDLINLMLAMYVVAEAVKISNKFISIVIKSTVLPGTTSNVLKKFVEEISGKKHGAFGLGANPEFLREGTAVNDFINADRIIIGAEDTETEVALLELYKTWSTEKVVVNSNTAEFIKYTNNCLLATLISFVNEMAAIGMKDTQIHFKDVYRGIAADKRISPVLPSYGKVKPEILSYLIPGAGYGGNCLPKDIKAFSSYAENMGVHPKLLHAVQEVNNEQPEKVIQLITRQVPTLLSKKCLVLGFAHKANTDDCRSSASISVIQKLLVKGAQVFLHDPLGLQTAKAYFNQQSNMYYPEHWLDYLSQADVIIILTPWNEYLQLPVEIAKRKISGKVIVDVKLVFEAGDFSNSTYISF